jgi:hypothetical protein
MQENITQFLEWNCSGKKVVSFEHLNNSRNIYTSIYIYIYKTIFEGRCQSNTEIFGFFVWSREDKSKWNWNHENNAAKQTIKFHINSKFLCAILHSTEIWSKKMQDQNIRFLWRWHFALHYGKLLWKWRSLVSEFSAFLFFSFWLINSHVYILYEKQWMNSMRLHMSLRWKLRKINNWLVKCTIFGTAFQADNKQVLCTTLIRLSPPSNFTKMSVDVDQNDNV